MGDPVGAGLVKSLARPGGNITGYATVGLEADSKRLALLRELVPSLRRVGMLEYPPNPYYRAAREEFERACRLFGIQPIIFEVVTVSELQAAIVQMTRRCAQAPMGSPENLFFENRVSLIAAALKHSLPVVTEEREILQAGALVLYAPSEAEKDWRNAAFVDRILRGARTADVPVEQPTRFHLTINFKAAKLLGIKVPRALLARANDVIR